MIRIDYLDQWRSASRAEGVTYRAREGALTLGVPDTLVGKYKYLIYFNNSAGGYATDLAHPDDTIHIQGNFSWSSSFGVPYLLLEDGKVKLPKRSFPEAIYSTDEGTLLFVAALIYLPHELDSSAYIFAQQSSDGIKFGINADQKLFVQYLGGNKVQTKTSDFFVPTNQWVSVMLIMQGAYRRSFYIRGALICGKDKTQIEESYNRRSLITVSDVPSIVSGNFGIAFLGVTSSQNGVPDASVLRQGLWVSDVYSFDREKQVYLLEVDGDFPKGTTVQVLVEGADNPMMIGAQKTGVELAEDKRVYAVQPVSGRHFRVSISMETESLPPVLDKVLVRMADYPLALPITKQVAHAPGTIVSGQLVPEKLDYSEIKVGVAIGARFELYDLSQSWSGPPADATSFAQLSSTGLLVRDGRLWEVRSLAEEVPDWLKLSSPFMLKISGKLVLDESTTYMLGLDVDGAVELYVDGRLVHAVYGATWNGSYTTVETKLDSGPHDIELIYIGETGRLALAMSKQGEDLTEIKLTELMDPALRQQGSTAIRGSKLSALVHSTTDVIIQGELGTARSLLPVQHGWQQHGWSARREFSSPYLLNPPLKPSGALQLQSRVHHDPIADDLGRLYLVDEDGIVTAVDPGCEPVWRANLSTLVGATCRPTGFPCTLSGLVVIPTDQGLVALEREAGGLRWTVVREGAWPLAFLLHDGRFLYVTWSDATITKVDTNGNIIRAYTSSQLQAMHVDIPHGDSEYSDVSHVDTPHGDVAHADEVDHRDRHINVQGTNHLWGPHTDAGYEKWVDHQDEGQTSEHRDIPLYSESIHLDSEHQDTIHEDVPHADVSHSDAEHADVSEEEVSEAAAQGRGSGLEVGYRHELAFWTASGAAVLNEDLTAKFVISAKESAIVWAILNDEVGDLPGLRTLAVLEAGGLLRLISAEDGLEIAEIQLDEPGPWCFPIGGGWLVASGTRLIAYTSTGDEVLSIDLGERPLAVPVTDREGKLFIGTENRILVIDANLSIVDETPVPGGARSITIWSDGNLAVVSESKLYLFTGASERPVVGHLVFPGTPREGEQVWLLDRSRGHSSEVASCRWMVLGEVHQARDRIVTFPWHGLFKVKHQVFNKQGQGSEELIPIYAAKRVVQHLPRRAYIMAAPRNVWITGGDEEMLIVPALGLDELYRDERVQVSVDLRGQYSDLTGATVKLVFKATEDEVAPPVLSKDMTITDPTLGLAEVTLEPSDLKAMTAGQRYYWSIQVTVDGVTDVVARGTTLIRQGMA